MRENKYRGMTKKGNWVYGYYTKTAFGSKGFTDSIVVFNGGSTMPYAVIPETVGQYTGLKDKNGIEIYEGDKCKVRYFKMVLGGKLGVIESEEELEGVIQWGAYGWAIGNISGKHWRAYTGYDDGEGSSNLIGLSSMNEGSIHDESFEVTGNIHEGNND